MPKDEWSTVIEKIIHKVLLTYSEKGKTLGSLDVSEKDIMPQSIK